MIIIAKRLANSLLDKKFKSKYELLGIPQITEENIYQIFNLAKKFKIPWWYLMQITFTLQNIHSKGFALHWGVGNQLELEIHSPHGTIAVGLVREKFNQREKSDHLLRIKERIDRAQRVASYYKGEIPQ
jgi:hypothetical protein